MRATLAKSKDNIYFSKEIRKSMKIRRAWDRKLQLFSANEEFQVNTSHQLALITSNPFVTPPVPPGIEPFWEDGGRAALSFFKDSGVRELIWSQWLESGKSRSKEGKADSQWFAIMLESMALRWDFCHAGDLIADA